MLPGQLDLFVDCTLPSTGLVGLQLRLASACNCGCNIVVIGSAKGPHSAAITCAECRQHRGWLSHAEFDRIASLINESGRPAGLAEREAQRTIRSGMQRP